MSSIPPIDPNQFNNPSQKVIPQQPKIQIPKNTSQRLQTQSEIEDLYKCLQVINKFQQTSVEKKFIPSPEKILQAKEFFSLYDIYYFLDTTILHIIEIEVDRCLTNIIKHRYRTEDQLVFHSIIKMHLYPEALLTQLQKDFSIVCTYLLENKFELAKKELEFFKIHFSKYKSLLVNKAIIKTDLVQTLDINIDSLEILFLSGEDQIQFVMQPLDKKYVTYNNEYLKNILLIMVQSQHRYIEFFKNLNLSRCNIILEQEWIKNLNHEKYSELKTSIESCCNEANKLQTCHNEWNNAVSVVLEGFRNIIEFVMSNDKFVFGHTFKTQFYLDFVIFTQNFEKYIEETKANICSVVEAQVKFDEQKLKTIDSFNELSSTSKTNNTPIKFLDLDRLTKYSDRLVQVWISRSETLANTTWMSLKTCQLHSLMLLRDIETFNDLIECTDPKGSYVCRLDLVCNKLILYYRRCNPVFKQSISIDNAKWKTYLMVEELFNSIVHLIKLLYDFTKKFNDSQVLNRTDLNFIVERKKQYYKILKKRENYFKTKDFVETEQIKSFYNFVKYIFIIMENPCVGVTYFIGPGDYARKCSFYNPNIKAAYIFLREYGISNFQNMSEFPLFKTYVTIVKNQKKAFFKAVPTTKFYKLLDELELILKTFPKIVEEVIQKSKSCNELVHEVFNIYYNHQPNLLKICISLKKESISYPLEKLDSIIEFGFQGEGSLYHYINNYFLLALQPIIARLYFTELPDSLKQIQNIHSINDSLKEGRENSFLDELSKDIQSQITEEVIAEEIQKIIENDPLTILVQCHQWLKDVKKLKIIPLNNEHINDIGRRQKQVRESLGTLNYCLMLIYSQWDQSNNNNQMALMDAVYYRASIFLEQALKLVINFLPIALPERSDKHQIFSEVSRSGSHVKLKTIHDIKFLVNMLDKYLLDSNILWKLPENLDAYLDEWTLVISQQGRYPGIKSGVIANDEIDMSKLYNKRERLQYIHNRLIHNVGLSENQKEELTAIESDPSKQLECIADRLSDVDVCIREILDRAKDKGCMALKVALATFNVIKEFK